jgi:hypothetical protein
MLLLLVFIQLSGVRIGYKRAKASAAQSTNWPAALVAAYVAFLVFGVFTYNLTKLYYAVSWVLLGLIAAPTVSGKNNGNC